MFPSDDASVSIANRLATSLCCDEGLATFRLLVQLQSARPGAPAHERPSASDSVRVGIWERPAATPRAPFVRIAGAGDWHLWADVQEIKPKGAAPRIVVIGESVARGFFYDPFVTPSSVLAMLLRSAAGREVDVVDLARSSLPAADLLTLTESAVALEPDAIVVLAGNNWHPLDGLTAVQLREMGAIVRGGPWREVKRYLEDRLREKTRRVVAALGRVRVVHGVPLVVMIPEFNLADWRADADEPPLLADDELARWLGTRHAALHALASGQLDDADRHAQALIDLDGGTSAAGFRLRARVAARSGAPVPRSLLEGVRDAAMWSGRRETPRCYGVIQETLRDEAPAHGLQLIDLPRRFEAYLDGQPPDRRLFGDYCHFTIEGMRVAMASAAEAVLPACSSRRTSWRALLDADLHIPVRVLAQGSFAAAVHNANWGNDGELVAHHVDRALAADPSIEKVMRLFLDFHLRRTPAALCGAFERMARTESPLLVPFFYRSARSEKDINFDLAVTIADRLARIDPAIADETRHLLMREHAASADGRSLLQRAYTGLAIDQSLDQEGHAYFRAARRVSCFKFVCREGEEARVRLTARVPGAEADDVMTVRVNGTEIVSAPATPCWQRLALNVPRTLLAPGLNELEVVWPESAWAYARRTASLLAALDEGRVPQTSAVFGEIHLLDVAVAAIVGVPRLEHTSAVVHGGAR